jgi:putative ATP-binding cassette transporter
MISVQNVLNLSFLFRHSDLRKNWGGGQKGKTPAILATGLISLLLRTSRGVAVVAIIAGLVGGISSTGVIAVINTTLHGGGVKSILVWNFVGLCLIRLIASVISNVLLTYLDQEIILDLRIRLAQQILNTPLRRLEEVGPQRLWGALGGDIFNITAAVTNLPLFCIHLASSFVCLIYLAWLSWTVFFIVFGFVVLGLGVNHVLINLAMRYVTVARRMEDSLLKHFHSLIYGVKELKLHRKRRNEFLWTILWDAALAFRRHIVVGMTMFTTASTWGSMMFYVVIGLLIFAIPNIGGAEQLSIYTLILVYMMGSLSGVLSTFPVLGRASVALKNLQSLGMSPTRNIEVDNHTTGGQGERGWESIELAGVAHTYYQEDQGRSFTLGPINLTFNAGELIFLSGGNGSGKTTLAKVLTGLYLPESGEIRVDGVPIVDANRDDYRQKFSITFFDFHLFDRLMGYDCEDLDSRANQCLVELQLDQKVQVNNGVFSTIELSQGQRKRLALLSAYLEDRQFYIFDEWAADQDQTFREVFYLQILPSLKKKGKTVLVISHDDRYYHLADRLIKLDYGSVQYVKDNTNSRETCFDNNNNLFFERSASELGHTSPLLTENADRFGRD